MAKTDRRGFEELALPLVDSLYSTAARMTDPASAEDLVQETLIKAWRAFQTWEQGTNFRAWIFRILTNTYISEYRRRSRGPVVYDFSETDVADPGAEVRYLKIDDAEALKERLGDDLKHAIERLPAEFRLVFLLSSVGEFGYREISEIAGIPIGTVMSRLFRARTLLRQELSAALSARRTSP
jgi:RNA polymerase sigma-70 factor (ECF subfamily)